MPDAFDDPTPVTRGELAEALSLMRRYALMTSLSAAAKDPETLETALREMLAVDRELFTKFNLKALPDG